MRLYVLARNYQDFKRWCWEKGIPELHATYVANTERLAGSGMLNAGQVVRVKGHEDNINSAQIEAHLRIVIHAPSPGVKLS